MHERYHPAERLLQLWTSFRDVGREDTARATGAVWAKVLEMEADVPIVVVMPVIPDIFGLVATVRKLAANSANVPPVLLKRFTHVEMALCVANIERPVGLSLPHMSDEVQDDLTALLHILKIATDPEGVVVAELMTLPAELDALAERIRMVTDISDDVRNVLLKCVEKMRHALAMYRIEGVEAFRSAWKSSVGELVYAGNDALQEAGPKSKTGFAKMLSRFETFAAENPTTTKLLAAGAKIVTAWSALSSGAPPFAE